MNVNHSYQPRGVNLTAAAIITIFFFFFLTSRENFHWKKGRAASPPNSGAGTSTAGSVGHFVPPTGSFYAPPIADLFLCCVAVSIVKGDTVLPIGVIAVRKIVTPLLQGI